MIPQKNDLVRVTATGRTGTVQHVDDKPLGRPPAFRCGVLVYFDEDRTSDWFAKQSVTVIHRPE